MTHTTSVKGHGFGQLETKMADSFDYETEHGTLVSLSCFVDYTLH